MDRVYARGVASATSRPRLRPVEVVLVPDERYGMVILLRDPQGIAPRDWRIPLELRPIVGRFDGRRTCREIARQVADEVGEAVPVEFVVRVAQELEDRLYAHGPAFDAARHEHERAFAESPVRPASHAGGAYHRSADDLARYIEHDCFAAAAPNGQDHGRLVGLVAPHIDPWRGARCYGEAYGVLGKSLPSDVDTFVLFGTSHAPMVSPFALCKKAFETPFGLAPADEEAVDRLAAACRFDPWADQINHKREHSLEFQVVFLKHLMGARPFRIVPILAGLGRQQASGTSPRESAEVERFLEAVREVVDDRRAVLVAGADLAHVGPRFGDPRALADGERHALDQLDRESLAHAIALDAERFFTHVASDLDTRRVCGLAPVYALLRTLPAHAKGLLRHYEQTVDPDEGSIVSHAAVGFFDAPAP